jgi:hypothetical protein
MYPTPKPHPVERHCPKPHPVAPTVERAPLLQVSSRTPPSLFQNAHIGPARGPHQSSPRPRSHNMLLEDFSFSGIPSGFMPASCICLNNVEASSLSP